MKLGSIILRYAFPVAIIACLGVLAYFLNWKLLRSLGAEIVLTDAKDGMPGAIAEANALAEHDVQ